MCGIAGVFSPTAHICDTDIRVVERMNQVLQHRGPDDEGIYHDQNCVLAHRRLAIIDLSKDGHQPFQSDDGRFQLIYNGEIYNYIELREELKKLGWRFKTKTDTEVLLKAYQQYGENCLSKFNGMFAFAIYDSRRNSIFFARDRFGIKPLYYAILGTKCYFASEIKALRAIPKQNLSINFQAVFDYLVFNRTDIYDETFLNGIKRIPKGHYGIFDCEGLCLAQWWNPMSYVKISRQETMDKITQTIEEILISAVKLRMRSDVPVGSCLSGGLDSSILTGILFTHCDVERNYATFTASFPGYSVDETRYVDSLNNKYSFKNYRTYPNADAAYTELQKFIYIIDEPFAGASSYSQYEVMRLAKAHGVTVLLDGQGGDESFAGYQYFHGFYMNGLLQQRELARLASEFWKVVSRRQDRSAYQTFLFQILPDRTKKRLLLEALPYIEPDFFFAHIDKSRIYNEFFDAPDLNTSLVRHFQYKLEHLLRLEDRNSMAFSLEARVPYLDYRFVEYMLSVPGDLKIRSGETKYLQKRAVGKYTVPEILNRKDKIGFGTPMDDWMSTKFWQNLTIENHGHLISSFPKVFKKNTQLPSSGTIRWKINQLTTWNKIAFG